MKISVIKKLVNTYSLQQLQKAEKELIEGDRPSIDLELEPDSYLVASDEPDYHDEKAALGNQGEDLTHVMAAVWIKSQMTEKGVAMNDAIRQYSQRIRDSIS